MSGPMDYTRRVMAYGLDVGELCREAVRAYEPYYRDTDMWGRLLTLPKWERVEVLISLYGCLHFTAKVPDGEPLDRALWVVAHETSLFHKNVLYYNDSKETDDEG